MIVSAMINAAVIYMPAIFALIGVGMGFGGIYVVILGYATNDDAAYEYGIWSMKMCVLLTIIAAILYYGGVILC